MGYEPRPGSVPAQIIHLLEGLEGGCVSRGELARHLGRDSQTIEPCIAAAIKAGRIRRNKALDDGQVYYSLGDGPLPETQQAVVEPAGSEQPVVSGFGSGTPFEFCVWHDGDLDIFGLEMLERPDGRQHVRLTRQQLEQIVSVLFGTQMTVGCR